MKKIFLSVVAAVSALSTFAQADTAFAKETANLKYRTEAGRFGVEAGINLKDGFSVNGGLINANYTLTDKLTARLGFGLSVDRNYEHNDEISKGEMLGIEVDAENDSKDVRMETSMGVYPGISYSFKGTERLEPYVGAELAFGFNKLRTRESEDFTNNKDSEDNYNTKTVTTDTDLFFGANGFTGFKFYLCKDLYVGAELSFGFTTKPDHISNSEVEDSRINPVDEVEDDSKYFKHETNIDLHFRPTLTLGWKF